MILTWFGNTFFHLDKIFLPTPIHQFDVIVYNTLSK